MTHVAVVGAGITGLSLAHHLDQADVPYRVLEAAENPGGVIRSGRVDDRLLEWGPQRIRRTPPIDELIDHLDLENDVIEAEEGLQVYVYANGSLGRVPTSLRGFLTTDLLSRRAKLRVLAEPLTSRGDPDETAAELFTRKFGSDAYEHLIGPLFGGIYASDPANMPARHALEAVLRLEREAGSLLRAALDRLDGDRALPLSFEEGLQQLPRALYEAHADAIDLDTRVSALRQWGDTIRVETEDETIEANHVVLTTPAPETASLLSGLSTDSQAFSSLTYNSLAIVHLHAEIDERGLGYQVGYDEDMRTLGVSWNAPTFGRNGVYTAFLGGMRDPAVLELDDEDIGDLARREFASVMDTDAEVLAVTRLDEAFPAYDHTWDAIEDLTLPDGIHLATNYTARMGVPSRVREAATLASDLAGSDECATTDRVEATP